MGPRNHALDGGPDPHEKQAAIIRGKSIATLYRELCKKRLNRSRCHLGYRLGWAKGSICITWGVHIGATLLIPLNHPCGGNAACWQITLTTCLFLVSLPYFFHFLLDSIWRIKLACQLLSACKNSLLYSYHSVTKTILGVKHPNKSSKWFSKLYISNSVITYCCHYHISCHSYHCTCTQFSLTANLNHTLIRTTYRQQRPYLWLTYTCALFASCHVQTACPYIHTDVDAPKVHP